MRGSLCLLLALGLAACDDDTPKSACVPGHQIACACPSGEAGVQLCTDDGSRYGACLPCGDDATDELEPSELDGDTGNELDGDTGNELDGEVAPDSELDDGGPSTACTSPFGEGPPTPGRCVDGAAVTCDLYSETLVEQPCGPDATCETFTIEEHPDPMSGAVPRSYAWAACIPNDAQRCELAWTPNPSGSYPVGFWQPGVPPGCIPGGMGFCWSGVPDALSGPEINAGSTTGWVHLYPCDSDEECGRDTFGDLRCFAAPLEPCEGGTPRCEGDTVLGCPNGPWLEREDCGSWGMTCDMTCTPDGPAGPACVTPLPAEATPCDPDTFVESCADTSRLTHCEDCRFANGSCTCYAYPERCEWCTIGGEACQCVTLLDWGEPRDSCVSATFEVCDYTTAEPTCEGNTAVRCNGVELRTACSNYGLSCLVANDNAGCVDPSLTACDAANPMGTCEAGQLVRCCPSSGLLDVNAYLLPCAPGYELRVDCAAFYSGLHCEFGMCIM